MNPTWFLRIGGLLSLGIGILGIVSPFVLGPLLWFDLTENIVHTAAGLALLALGWIDTPYAIRRAACGIIGTISLIVGIGGLWVQRMAPLNFLGITNLEHPIDNLLHLGFGIWALAVFLASSQPKSEHKYN